MKRNVQYVLMGNTDHYKRNDLFLGEKLHRTISSTGKLHYSEHSNAPRERREERERDTFLK